MSRFAHTRRVFFFEEPVFEDGQPQLRSMVCQKTGVNVLTPVLPHGLNGAEITHHQELLLSSLLKQHSIHDFAAWYYTPMALEFTSALRPQITIYDCMDELSAFRGAPPAMRNNEATLFNKADLVFTGGASLFESKRKQHQSVHLFPSSVEVAHFAQARTIANEPDDQQHIPHPRIGYAGVIDERMDLSLLREVAAARPDWHLVMLGPVVKIHPDSLPLADNIHYLGMKAYSDLPAYFSGWQIGMLPFALNESTRFISPTKTPEYLAAGLHVISSPIRDVVKPYCSLGLVRIAQGTSDFLRFADELLGSQSNREFRMLADQFLSQSSWDKTWSEMNQLIENKLAFKLLPSGGRSQVATSAHIATKGLSNV